jgi:glycosyltransferase involved in cell wall biosynthesis
MRKTKILHVTHAHGGIKTFIENIVNFSSNDKFEHYIVGTDVIKNYGIKFKQKKDIFISRAPNPIQDIISLIKIIFYIRSTEPDIIHCHSAKGGFIGRLAAKYSKKKCVYTPNAFSYLGFQGVKKYIFIYMEIISKYLTDMLLAVSNSEAQRAEFEVGYKKKKISTIKNSIIVEKNDLLPNNFNSQKIGMVGRLIYQKNPLMFFKVASLIHKDFPDIKFELLGAGYQDYLSKEAECFIKENKMELYCSIRTWGTNKDEMKEFYESLAIFILTSNFEGLPYSLLEAMSKGIPCVVTEADGNRDVIKDYDNGFIVPINDANLMAQKISLLLSDKELYRQIAIQGYQTVFEKHNIKKNITQYEDIYLKLYKQ